MYMISSLLLTKYHRIRWTFPRCASKEIEVSVVRRPLGPDFEEDSPHQIRTPREETMWPDNFS